MIKIRRVFALGLVGIMLFGLNITSYAADMNEYELQENREEDALSMESREMILNELNISEENLSEEDEIALFSSGVVWDESYSAYSIRKSLAMSALLTSTDNLPYTAVIITNKGNTSITAIAYKGAVAGSDEIRSISISPGNSKTLYIYRSDIIKYGTMNGQGNMMTLSFTVSMYNPNGNKMSCSVYGVKYIGNCETSSQY